MTHGTLGIIACPMLDDNLVFGLKKDAEEKYITIIDNKNNGSLRRKLEKELVPYETIGYDDLLAGKYCPDPSKFNVLVLMVDLGLHSRPEELKSAVEKSTREMQPYADAFGFYLGTCGNFNWDIPEWCAKNGLRPAAMFRDAGGNLCHDCVGVNVAGGPRYNEMMKKYTGHFYVFPAMASNYDDFMGADQADALKTEESLTDEIREALGIEPGRDGYMRWLLNQGDYKYILKLDTGIGNEHFDEDLQKISDRTRLKVKVAEEGWATLHSTNCLYAKCKSMLGE
jgi:hypothetical protein